MRLEYVEICGFRGVRDKLRINFGGGFTVITGRNGVGKSTLCDAVEFAITGLIEKYTVEKAAKETLADYLWWRGYGTPTSHYVTVSFLGDNGEVFTITRTRESGADRSVEEIETALCSESVPDDALRQLTRTTIIRDERIAALSLDLSETERFDLVRSALGALEGSEAATKAKEIVTAADLVHSGNEIEYDTARTKLGEYLTQKAEIQTSLARAGDVSSALAILATVAPDSLLDLTERLDAARSALADGRSHLARMAEAIEASRELVALQRAYNEPNAVEKRESVWAHFEKAREEKDVALAAASRAEELLRKEEDADAVAASLASLVEHGEKLGLHDEHCPLCAASRNLEQFAQGLAAARRRLSVLASGVQEAKQAFSMASNEAQKRLERFQTAKEVSDYHRDEERKMLKVEKMHAAFLTRWNIDVRYLADPDTLQSHLDAERDKLINLERALFTLETSQSVTRMASIERDINEMRLKIDKLADAVSKSGSAASMARDIERAVKRVSAEIIDERLAQISPLLNELYQRLRPHADWRTIEYSIRGDVKRFLSLKVGDGLNPQFVFSSGQRRAAGLAFLISVHMARAWTPLRTLILDDPVQHIDDFRALHLVEVLAALRQDHRQIICAVEDPALADLLCRRLVSTIDEPGRRYDIDLGAEGSTSVVNEGEVPPMPANVLKEGLHIVA